MNTEKLESLYKERLLLKQLISINEEKYSYLNGRVSEIKMIINSEYSPIPFNNERFILYSLDLAEKITNHARQIIRDIPFPEMNEIT